VLHHPVASQLEHSYAEDSTGVCVCVCVCVNDDMAVHNRVNVVYIFWVDYFVLKAPYGGCIDAWLAANLL